MRKQALSIVKFYRKFPRKLIPVIALIAVTLFLFFGMPDEMLYAKSGVLKWFPYLLIFGIVPWLIFEMLHPHHISKVYILGICGCLVLILGPAFGFWTGIYSNKDLEENGALARGVIIEKQFNSYPSKEEWLVKGNFYFNGKKYSTFSEVDVHDQYSIGDSITIRFSKEYPDNNRILELIEKKDAN